MCARRLLVAMGGLVVVLGVGAPAWGQTAGMLSFQGLLKDAGGVPVNGAVTLQFRIYDAQMAGALVDMDGSGVVEDVIGKDAKQVSATAAKGIVSTKFGPVSAKAFNGSARWLEVRVNGTALTRTEMATAAATAEQMVGTGSATPELFAANGRVAVGWTAIVSSPYTPGSRLTVYGTNGDGWNSGIELYREDDGMARIAVDTEGLKFRTWRVGAGYHFRNSANNTSLFIDDSGRVGVGTTSPATKLDVDGAIRIRGGSDLAEPFVVGSDGATKRRSDVGIKEASDGAGGGHAADSQLETRNPQLASPQPGMVVVIDPANPGRLKLATEAYDRKVAGIISGANGLKPGMVMSGLGNAERGTMNDERSGGRSASDEATERRGGEEPSPQPSPSKGEGVAVATPGPGTRDPRPEKSDTLTPSLSLEGRGGGDEHPVALTGRVYVWADASYGPIEPGDMLTTSATAGHAMKAADRERSFGAVIGKAMTPLKGGKGLVLVLVNLQ